jgi:hypothetical protein
MGTKEKASTITFESTKAFSENEACQNYYGRNNNSNSWQKLETMESNKNECKKLSICIYITILLI